MGASRRNGAVALAEEAATTTISRIGLFGCAEKVASRSSTSFSVAQQQIWHQMGCWMYLCSGGRVRGEREGARAQGFDV